MAAAAPWWGSRGAAWAAWALAGWPVWRWYGARITDGSDEPWGIVALVVAGWFLPWRRWREPVPIAALAGAGACFLAVFLGYDQLPALVRGGLWMTAFAVLPGGHGPAAARGGLLLLSLPVVATAQFYLGYPLRIVTAACSVPVLRALGFTVTREGTALRWAGETVLVDAPCSGIQMLWTGLFVACALAAVHGLGTGATLRLLRRAGALVALGNVLRCVALFVVEVRRGTPPEWLHAGIGVAVFAGVLGAVVWCAGRSGGERLPTAAEDEPASDRRTAWWARGADWLILPVVLLLIGVAVRPLASGGASGVRALEAFPGWPSEFEGRALTALEFSVREARFAAGFPGRVAAFSDGERTILFRWVPRETRKLHPAADCLRGLGYAVTPGPVWRDGTGANWGTVNAEREGRSRRVRERLCDAAGREWTDVSAWWWAAWSGASDGPWWATTVFDR